MEVTLRRRRILFAGFVARRENTGQPNCAMYGEMVGGAGCVGGHEKEWMGSFLDDLRAFGINAEQTTAAQDEGEWHITAKQGATHFMGEWIVAEKAKARLRHAVVCPNVTGRTKERIGRLVLVRSPLLTSHKWRELVSSGRLVCRCHDVFLWCYICFVLLRFRLYAFFVEAAALYSIVLWYAGAPIATRVSFFFPFVYLEKMSPFPSMFCTNSTLSLHGECMCVCVFFLFILDIKFVRRASRATQEEGHTGFFFHLLSAVRASIFLARGFSHSFPSSSVKSNFVY